MRINRDTLLKIAQDTVAQRARADRSIQSIYMCGALLGEDVLLGGTADIDLVFVHIDRAVVEREIVPLTQDVHVDIAHHFERDYRQVRQLRLHPWLGPTIAGCKILYDPHHLMDFTQASVRGQFNQPENVLRRARPQMEQARRDWMALEDGSAEAGPERLSLYLRAVGLAANAVASLSGTPLTERRFLLNFPQRAEDAGQPGLYPGLLGLIGAPQIEPDNLREWLPAWQTALEGLSELGEGADVHPRLHTARTPYYYKAFESILIKDQPLAALWPLLKTWTDAARALPEDHQALEGWQEACRTLKLADPPFAERLQALDAYLDLVEETLERWGRENGVRENCP